MRWAKLISLLLLCGALQSQTVTHVYKINGLLKRISSADTTYVINFWATWCKPCVQELPAFDSLNVLTKNTSTKIILVSLDFKEELEKKVKPFLAKHHIQTECVLLDEVNGNDFINQISADWSGAIPATLFKKGNKKQLIESKLRLSELLQELKTL